MASESAPVEFVAARGLDRRAVTFMAVLCGACVANIYYVQPLLAELGRSLGASESQMGWVATLSQVGYGAGVLLIVPAGDIWERRRLIVWLAMATSLSALWAGASGSVGGLTLAHFAIGFFTVIPQVIMPYAAALSTPAQRGKVVGLVQGGLLIGILLARSVSGTVAQMFGWRAVYFMAAGLMLGAALVVQKKFPRQELPARTSYWALLKSLGTLARTEPRLQRAALSSLVLYGVFGALWTTLSFLLASPAYGYGPGVAGMFGLIGVVGALVAPLAGHWTEKSGMVFVQRVSFATLLAAFGLFAGGATHVGALVAGVILLDAGIQGNHIANQVDVLAIRESARSRLNGVYMFFRFLGGSFGSLAGTWAWGRWQWAGVCALGLVLCAAGWAVFELCTRRPSMRRAA